MQGTSIVRKVIASSGSDRKLCRTDGRQRLICARKKTGATLNSRARFANGFHTYKKYL